MQGRGFAVGEQVVAGRHPLPAVDHDAHRVATRGSAYGQAWIIGAGRSSADHHRVTQGADSVQVGNAVVTVDKPGAPSDRGDPSIEALAKLADHAAVPADGLTQ